MLRKTRAGLLAGIAAGLCMSASNVGAQILISAGNHPQPDEENVLLAQGQTGTTVSGATNQSSLPITLQTITNQTLHIPSNGQARVEAESAAAAQIPLDSLKVFVTNGGSFSDLIFNAFIGGGTGSAGTITITANPFGGGTSVSQSFGIGNGSNFFTIVASGTVRLDNVQFTTTATNPNNAPGVADARQIRISGASPTGLPPTGGQVPEPGAMSLLAGVSVPVLCLCMRRRGLRQ